MPRQQAIITEIDEKIIRADLQAMQDKLKVTLSEIYIPKNKEILFTIGSQWKQRYLIERDGNL